MLVVGLGKSGVASVEALSARGADVIATDEKPPAQLRDAVDRVERAGARFATPENLGDDLSGATLVVLSPGVPPSSPLARRVRATRIPLIGEVELASMLCEAPIIAVTGTKGKSTTAALIAHLMRACGKDVRLGGNIGDPLVGVVPSAPAHAWVVAELSSFQLETAVDLRPRISVLLNVAADHLDRYASIDEYAEAKFRIFANQGAGDAIVLDRDDARLAALEARFRARRCEAERLWYTLGPPSQGVAMALQGTAIVACAEGVPQTIADRTDVPLFGTHNARNAMAALLAAMRAGCEPESLRRALRTFAGLRHRLERVAEVDGVLYVDDSKATNPAAAAAALRSFEKPVVLIAGGREKGTDFAELGVAIRERAKSVIGIGEAARTIEGISGSMPFETASSMEEAVERAHALARSGEIVLLAPACASFDMFANAEERGERFARAVKLLAERAHA